MSYSVQKTPGVSVGVSGGISEKTVEAMARLGATEFFAGYVPPRWSERYGYFVSPNRRFRKESQFTAPTRLKNIIETAHSLGAEALICLNEHQYCEEQYELLREIVFETEELGADGYIVADPALMLEIKEWKPGARLTVSGCAGAGNEESVEFFRGLGASRITLPRSLGLADIAHLLERTAGRGVGFCCFIMEEPCRNEDAYCFTMHGYGREKDLCQDGQWVEVVSRDDGRVVRSLDGVNAYAIGVKIPAGLSRCGLCAVGPLIEAGVETLKIPGRSSDPLSALRLLKAVLDSDDRGADFCRGLLDSRSFCDSRNYCYYGTGGAK